MRFLRRVLNMLVVLLFVSLLMFVLVRVLPGDPVGAALGDGATKEQVEKFRAQMGMDKPCGSSTSSICAACSTAIWRFPGGAAASGTSSETPPATLERCSAR